MYIYIYIYTSVLLCIYMHRACGTISNVDHSAMLSWCKACITKNIHKFYHKFYLKAIANANDTIPFAGLMPMQLAMFCWFIGWLDCWLAACPSCCLLVQPALLFLYHWCGWKRRGWQQRCNVVAACKMRPRPGTPPRTA